MTGLKIQEKLLRVMNRRRFRTECQIRLINISCNDILMNLIDSCGIFFFPELRDKSSLQHEIIPVRKPDSLRRLSVTCQTEKRKLPIGKNFLFPVKCRRSLIRDKTGDMAPFSEQCLRLRENRFHFRYAPCFQNRKRFQKQPGAETVVFSWKCRQNRSVTAHQ